MGTATVYYGNNNSIGERPIPFQSIPTDCTVLLTNIIIISIIAVSKVSRYPTVGTPSCVAVGNLTCDESCLTTKDRPAITSRLPHFLAGMMIHDS